MGDLQIVPWPVGTEVISAYEDDDYLTGAVVDAEELAWVPNGVVVEPTAADIAKATGEWCGFGDPAPGGYEPGELVCVEWRSRDGRVWRDWQKHDDIARPILAAAGAEVTR